MACCAMPSCGQSLGLLFARLPIGVLFFMAGLNKVRPWSNLDGFVNQALPMAKNYMPESLGQIFVTGLPFVEMAVGALIVLGLFTRIVGFLASALLVSFMIAATKLQPHGGAPFDQNLMYLGLTLLLLFNGAGWISLDGMLFGRKKSAGATPAA